MISTRFWVIFFKFPNTLLEKRKKIIDKPHFFQLIRSKFNLLVRAIASGTKHLQNSLRCQIIGNQN